MLQDATSVSGPAPRRGVTESLYHGLSLLVRRSRDFTDEVRIGLTTVEYTLLREVEYHEGVRAVDLAAKFGLDKSTISRQVNHLIDSGLLSRAVDQPARRGVRLELTPKGDAALAAAANSIRAALTVWLADWSDEEIGQFAAMVERLLARIDADL
jgi:DNA-binding MarR family transcriptional regulator